MEQYLFYLFILIAFPFILLVLLPNRFKNALLFDLSELDRSEIAIGIALSCLSAVYALILLITIILLAPTLILFILLQPGIVFKILLSILGIILLIYLLLKIFNLNNLYDNIKNFFSDNGNYSIDETFDLLINFLKEKYQTDILDIDIDHSVFTDQFIQLKTTSRSLVAVFSRDDNGIDWDMDETLYNILQVLNKEGISTEYISYEDSIFNDQSYELKSSYGSTIAKFNRDENDEWHLE
tara:strand:- start:219 stop:935 length:717 start_codon:yes stop_codon:yes gene_type:complete